MEYIKNCPIIEIAAAVFAIGWSLNHWSKYLRSVTSGDNRTFDDRITDIRAMNVYNSYMLAGLMVFLGLSANGDAAPPKLAVYLLLVALCAAGLGILFLPLKNDKGVDDRPSRRLWMKTLLCTQIAVIGTVAGIFRVVAAKLG